MPTRPTVTERGHPICIVQARAPGFGFRQADGSLIGVPHDRDHNMITQSGNCGKIHDRNPGPATGRHTPGGMNHSRVHGGLHHPPPIRRMAEPRTISNQPRANQIGARTMRASEAPGPLR